MRPARSIQPSGFQYANSTGSYVARMTSSTFYRRWQSPEVREPQLSCETTSPLMIRWVLISISRACRLQKKRLLQTSRGRLRGFGRVAYGRSEISLWTRLEALGLASTQLSSLCRKASARMSVSLRNSCNRYSCIPAPWLALLQYPRPSFEQLTYLAVHQRFRHHWLSQDCTTCAP